MNQAIYIFLYDRSPKLCSFATASANGKTELSVMGYAVKEDLSMILSTKATTRKIDHIKENPQTSFVVGWDFKDRNVQMDGTAKIIEDQNEIAETESFFFKQNPAAKKFKDDSTIFIHFSPSWCRFTDPTVSPPTMEEKDLP